MDSDRRAPRLTATSTRTVRSQGSTDIHLAGSAVQGREQPTVPRSKEPALPMLRQVSQHPVDAEAVVCRLEEAGHTLLCLPPSGPSTNLRQTRHQYVADAIGVFNAETDDRHRPPVPSAVRITRMDQALAWIPLIPADKLVLRRVVGCRCLVSPLTERHLFTWRRLARLVGADHKAVQRWHAAGIDIIVATLRRDAALAKAWDSLR